MARLSTATRRMYADFMAEFPYCMRCGYMPDREWRGWMWNRLDNAHILGGCCRTHDRRNLLRLCDGCHRSERAQVVIEPGLYVPKLTLAGKLWLKAEYDPDHWDPDYLRRIGVKQWLPHPIRPKPLPELAWGRL